MEREGGGAKDCYVGRLWLGEERKEGKGIKRPTGSAVCS
jgi:hypothetical protein